MEMEMEMGLFFDAQSLSLSLGEEDMASSSLPSPSSSTTGSSLCRHSANSKEVGGKSLAEKQKYLHDNGRGLASRRVLESWRRKDILHLLCLETGEEQKYTSVPKSKMIDDLLRFVSARGGIASSPTVLPRKQRKGGRPPLRVPALALEKPMQLKGPITICENTACKAQLGQGAAFCKRCSCCICRAFDDNKDPSLWIVCTPERGQDGCGLSCHAECALERGLAGVVTDGSQLLLDGNYRCGSCGAITDLIGCWRKQLMIAKEARRVDTLCHRLLLSQRLLNGTVRYRSVHEMVERAIIKLQAEVGSISEGPNKFARGIVNRLSSGADVHRLIELALKMAEPFLPDDDHSSPQGSVSIPRGVSCAIMFSDVLASSIMVEARIDADSTFAILGCKLWHRKASDSRYPSSPTRVLRGGEKMALIPNLQAATEYVFRLVPFSESGDAAQTEALCSTKSIQVIEPLPPPPLDRNKLGFCDGEASFKVRNLANMLHPDFDRAETVPCEAKGEGESEAAIVGNRGLVSGQKSKPSLNAILNSLRAGRDLKGGGGVSVNSKRMNGGNETINFSKPIRSTWMNVPPPLSSLDGDASSADGESPTDGKVVLEMGSKTFRSAKEGMVRNENNESGSLKTMRLINVLCMEEEESDPSMSKNARGDGGSLGVKYKESTRVEVLRRGEELESNGHAESWAVQVQSGKVSFRTEPDNGLLRKRNAVGGGGSMDNRANGAQSLCVVKSFEFCVKAIRWLELEGYLKKEFRLKFLSWFSLRATENEKRAVSVFIDTLQDSPTSLAEQLVDTFADSIFAKRQQVRSNGFHNQLWH